MSLQTICLSDPQAVSYCLSCRCVYTRDVGICSVCHGPGLSNFAWPGLPNSADGPVVFYPGVWNVLAMLTACRESDRSQRRPPVRS